MSVIISRAASASARKSASALADTSTGDVVVVPSGAAPASSLPSNQSNQQLVNEDSLEDSGVSRSSQDSGSNPSVNQRGIVIETPVRKTKVTKAQYLTALVLFYVNLINYMDRLTLAGILEDVQCNFQIGNSEGGLLQTVFVISYMLFAPLFGYLGDRYSRRWIMAGGVFLWSLTTFVGSFMDKSFTWFIIMRALVGIGEASYSTIAPTIISDMFSHDLRSKMLAFFYFAIPVGGGLGYIVGAKTAELFGEWQYALRVTPILGLIAVALIIFVMIDPPRGESEGSVMEATSYKEDLIYLAKNKSFMLSTFGFTCVTFVTGALSWWGPIFIYNGLTIQEGRIGKVEMSDVSLTFGVISMLSGLLGVPLGSYLSQKLRHKNASADPLICAFGLIASTPLIYMACVTARHHTYGCYALIFLGVLLLNFNWAIVADILLYTVVPTRRSTAEAFQILFSHAFGDAGSPYLVGIVSDWLKKLMASEEAELSRLSFNSTSNLTAIAPANATSLHLSTIISNCSQSDMGFDNPVLNFKSLQYSFFMANFVEIIGGIFFLATALYIVSDKQQCEDFIAKSSGGRLMPREEGSSQTEDDEEGRP